MMNDGESESSVQQFSSNGARVAYLYFARYRRRMTILEQNICDPSSGEHLFQRGYCIVRDQISPVLIDNLRVEILSMLAKLKPQDRNRFRFQGSMIPLHYNDPIAQELISHKNILQCLHFFGFVHPHWMSGYIISKPPHSAALWWHQDWWAWDEQCSTSRIPPQLFMNVYLQKTNVQNGCLRLLPTTHRQRIPLHDSLPIAHSHEANSADVHSSIFSLQPGEVSVEVEAGDIVFGDVRLLHASHSNTTDEERTCITLWYIPDFASLPIHLRSFINRHPCLPPHGWWKEAMTDVPLALRPLLPQDDAVEMPVSLNRVPGKLLRAIGE